MTVIWCPWIVRTLQDRTFVSVRLDSLEILQIAQVQLIVLLDT